MRWIEDIRQQLEEAPPSRGQLRTFGSILVTLLAALLLWKAGWWGRIVPTVLVGGGWLALLILVWVRPRSMAAIYQAWMTIALAIGWWISRLILAILFFGLLTPTALLARLAGKPFLDRRWPDPRPSFWVKRDPNRKTDYRKMF